MGYSSYLVSRHDAAKSAITPASFEQGWLHRLTTSGAEPDALSIGVRVVAPAALTAVPALGFPGVDGPALGHLAPIVVAAQGNPEQGIQAVVDGPGADVLEDVVVLSVEHAIAL